MKLFYLVLGLVLIIGCSSSSEAIIQTSVDSGVVDSNQQVDSNVVDSGVDSNVEASVDSNVIDSNTNETSADSNTETGADSNVVDSNVVDSAQDTNTGVDSNVVDSFVDTKLDTNVIDSNVVDTNVIDSNTTDSNAIDSNVADTNVIDSNFVDSNVADTNVADTADTAAPVCGDKFVNTSTEQCDDGNQNSCDGCESCQRRGYLSLPVNGEMRMNNIKYPSPLNELSFWYKFSSDEIWCNDEHIEKAYPELEISHGDSNIAQQNLWTLKMDRYDIRFSVRGEYLIGAKIPVAKRTGWHHFRLVVLGDWGFAYYQFTGGYIYIDGKLVQSIPNSTYLFTFDNLTYNPVIRVSSSKNQCAGYNLSSKFVANIDEMRYIHTYDKDKIPANLFEEFTPFRFAQPQAVYEYQGGIWHFDELTSPYFDSTVSQQTATTTTGKSNADNCLDNLFQ